MTQTRLGSLIEACINVAIGCESWKYDEIPF